MMIDSQLKTSHQLHCQLLVQTPADLFFVLESVPQLKGHVFGLDNPIVK